MVERSVKKEADVVQSTGVWNSLNLNFFVT